MTLDELKQELQRHFSDRLVTFVGSGLSVALGLPSMAKLSAALQAKMPSVLDVASGAKWRLVTDELSKGLDLESALGNCDDEKLNGHIRTIVADEIGAAERVVLGKLFCGLLKAPFSRLLHHLTFADKRAEVITPNYDRILEFATELAGYGVDTMFTGSLLGPSSKQSRDALSEFMPGRRKTDPPVRRYRPHIAIYKPHGSLDWYLHASGPVRSSLPLDAPRLMITPGAYKYRQGYEQPFDTHREAANNAIDRASRYLLMGYGFNDSQLEQHLRTRLKSGYSGLLLTYELTENAVRLLDECPSVTGLSSHVELGVSGTMYRKGSQGQFFPGCKLWDLDEFCREVLGV